MGRALGRRRFHLGPAPSVADVAAVGKRVAERMHRWMRRGKMFDQPPPEERSNEAPELSPLEACLQLSLFGGTFLKLDKNGVPLVDDEDDERHRSRTKSPWSADGHRCPCGGRRSILSDVTEPAAVVAILSHLGLPARAEPVASARDPGWSEAA